MQRKSTWAIYGIAILGFFMLMEGLSYAGLFALRTAAKIEYRTNPTRLSTEQRSLIENVVRRGGVNVGMDAELGWTLAESNSAGMRDDQEHPAFPKSDMLRISAFGDSFTFAADVDLAQSWGKQVASVNPSLEVLNYGMGGYGLDQAYLRYRRVATEYHPHIVFIGYMSENIARNVNVYRIFYLPEYATNILTKPRFQVKDGRLSLLKNPLPTREDYAALLRDDEAVLRRLGTNDYHYQMNSNAGALDFLATVRFSKLFYRGINSRLLHPIFKSDGMYTVNSEAYDVTVHIFDAFYRDVLNNGALPVIVVFPDISDQNRNRQGKPRRYTPLIDNFRSKGYRFIDLLDAIQAEESRYEISELTSKTFGHFSALGNQIIAKHLVTQLGSFGLTDVSKVQDARDRERARLGVNQSN